MKDEALKLALEALENSVDLVSNEAREAEKMYANLPKRLARVQGLVALEVAHENAITAIKQAVALDKKAENARELGLDYEPVPVQEFSYKGPEELWLQLHGDCSDDELTDPVDYTDDSVTWCWHQIHNSDVRYVRADIATPPAQPAPVQEPVAIALNTGTKQGVKWLKNVEHGESLYTTPPAQPAPKVVDCHATGVCVQSGLRAEKPAPVQEPVAWGIIASNTGRICQVELDADEVEGHNPKHVVPLYTTPPNVATPLAAQRPWFGLTEDEVLAIGKELGLKCKLGGNPNIDFDYAEAIEAKLKEKNSD